MHVDQPDLLAAVPDVIGHHRAVGHRVGVRHREHRGVAAQCRCCRTGFDVLGVLAARLTQVSVQVDEARQQDLIGRVDDVGVVGDRPGPRRCRRSGRRRPARRPGRLRRRAAPHESYASCADRLPPCPFLHLCARPADGTAPPSGRAHRWKPVAAQPIASSRPPRRRSPCHAASVRGAAPPRCRAASPAASRKARSSTEYSRADGKNPPFIRSACTRSISTASATGSSASRSCDTVTGQRSPRPAAASAAPPAPPRRRACPAAATLDRATRLCRMSPTITTRLPSMPPSRWRMVSASSSAWVGCSWVPSPALITDGPAALGGASTPASCWAAPGRGVADDQRVGARRAQRQGGVAQRLTLGHRRSRRADVDDVGAHPLAGHLERHPGAGGVLVEHRDDGAATQRRQLLDLAAQQRLSEPVGVVEDRGRLVAASGRRPRAGASHRAGPPWRCDRARRHGRRARPAAL